MKSNKRIIKLSLGRLQANCYILVHHDMCVIIDPADDANFILERILREKLNLLIMFATHGHFDHIMAVGEIAISGPLNKPLFMSEEDLFLVKRMNESAQYFLGYDPQAAPPLDIFEVHTPYTIVEDIKFRVLRTPGHTPGSLCYYLEDEKALFTGDTLFHKGVGRTDFAYADKEQLKKSLKKLFRLPLDTVVYPGHGDVTTLREEKEFLQDIGYL